MKSIKQQYIDLQEGNMSQANFMRNLRMTLPQYITNVTSFEDSVRILKNKGILTEADTNKEEPYNPIAAAHAEYTSPMDKMFTSDKWVKAQQDAGEDKDNYDEDETEETEDNYDEDEFDDESWWERSGRFDENNSLKEAKDEKGKWTNTSGKAMYDQFSEINNLNGQEVLIGIDYEIEKDHELTKEEATKIVIKNLKKDPYYYTTALMSGIEGYKSEYIGGKSAQPEARQMQPLDKNMSNVVDKKLGMQPVKGIEKPKKDSDKATAQKYKTSGIDLMSLVAKTVRGVKKMDATGEKMKKVSIKEGNLYPGEEWSLEPEGRFWILTYRTTDGKKEKVFQSEDEARKFISTLDKNKVASTIFDKHRSTVKGTNAIGKGENPNKEKSKLTKDDLMEMIREELAEILDGRDNVTDVAGHQLDEVKVGDKLKHKLTGAELEVIKVDGSNITTKYTKLGDMEGKAKLGGINKTNANLIGKTYELI